MKNQSARAKELYFNNKNCVDVMFRRDFIRYVIFRHPRMTREEAVEHLMRVVNVSENLSELKRAIVPVCDKYFKGEHLSERPDVAHDRLARWLRPGIVNDIAADYARLIDKELVHWQYENNVLAAVERLAWLQGIESMQYVLTDFVAKLTSLSSEFKAIPVADRDLQALNEKYEAACRITVSERLIGGNENDVSAYTTHLYTCARAECEEILYHKIAAVYRDLARSERINEVKDHMRALGSDFRNIPELAADAATDEPCCAAYDNLMPIGFFERNIEDIDGAAAFQMILLQMFARNEEQLRDYGMLNTGGEITLFTNPRVTPSSITLLLDTLVRSHFAL